MTSSAVSTIPASSIVIVICRAALAKLNVCRTICPGVGGDIDASNLNWLIENREYAASTLIQAARTLEGLSTGLGIDATCEVEALRSVSVLDAAPRLLQTVEQISEYDASVRQGWVDEWEEAAAFTECKRMATEVVEWIKARS